MNQGLNKAKILLVDDHDVVLFGLRHLIQTDSKFEVVGECRDAGEGLEGLKDKKPDVLIIDINMPGPCPFRMVKQARLVLPNLKVIFLTAFLTETNLRRMIACDADGVLSKGESWAHLVEAIHEIVENSVRFFGETARGLHKQFDVYSGTAKVRELSPREREILLHVASGCSAKKIGDILSISAKTVERHKSNMMSKLNVHSQVDLARYAIQNGIVSV